MIKQKKCSSMRELADIAGADISTVSRALNNDPRISAERGEAIRQLAEDVGYRPKPLRSKKTRSIGILVSTGERELPKNEFLFRITWLTQWMLGEQGRHVNVENVPADIDDESYLPELVKQSRVDGVILAGYFDENIVGNIREAGVPVVAINDSSERLGVSCVTSNTDRAIEQAVMFLAAKGHERFAYFNTNLNFPTVKARYETYISTLESFGIMPDKSLQLNGLSQGIDGGVAGVRKLVAGGQLPTAIFCCNDWVAMGAVQELQRQGLSVPGDVSVVGHDDLPFCEQLEPKLTSVHRDEKELAAKAVEILIQEVDGEHVGCRDVIMDGDIIWRESTGIAPERLK